MNFGYRMIEHERQERAEGRGERERDREQLGELVGQPVVALVSGPVADELDDQREDRHGEHEGREQQVELRDDPDRDAAPDDGKRPVLGLLVGLLLGLFLRVRLLGGLRLGADGRGLRQAPGARGSSTAIVTAPANITRPATGPRRTSSVRFVTAPPSMADRGRARSAWDLVVRKEAWDVPRTVDRCPRSAARRNDSAHGQIAGTLAGPAARAASPRWNCDATSSPLKRHPAQRDDRKPWIEAAILPTNSDEGQARVAVASKSLTAAVTGRMNIPGDSERSVLSSFRAARRQDVHGAVEFTNR